MGPGRDKPCPYSFPNMEEKAYRFQIPLGTELGHELRKLLRILFVRQMPALSKDYQTRIWNCLLKPVPIRQRHFAIAITPND